MAASSSAEEVALRVAEDHIARGDRWAAVRVALASDGAAPHGVLGVGRGWGDEEASSVVVQLEDEEDDDDNGGGEDRRAGSDADDDADDAGGHPFAVGPSDADANANQRPRAKRVLRDLADFLQTELAASLRDAGTTDAAPADVALALASLGRANGESFGARLRRIASAMDAAAPTALALGPMGAAHARLWRHLALPTRDLRLVRAIERHIHRRTVDAITRALLASDPPAHAPNQAEAAIAFLDALPERLFCVQEYAEAFRGGVGGAEGHWRAGMAAEHALWEAASSRYWERIAAAIETVAASCADATAAWASARRDRHTLQPGEVPAAMPPFGGKGTLSRAGSGKHAESRSGHAHGGGGGSFQRLGGRHGGRVEGPDVRRGAVAFPPVAPLATHAFALWQSSLLNEHVVGARVLRRGCALCLERALDALDGAATAVALFDRFTPRDAMSLVVASTAVEAIAAAAANTAFVKSGRGPVSKASAAGGDEANLELGLPPFPQGEGGAEHAPLFDGLASMAELRVRATKQQRALCDALCDGIERHVFQFCMPEPAGAWVGQGKGEGRHRVDAIAAVDDAVDPSLLALHAYCKYLDMCAADANVGADVRR